MPEAADTPETMLDLYHPAVALAYCGVVLVLALSAFHPVYLLLTLVGQLAWQVARDARGLGAAARRLLWQAPLVAVLALANPLFVQSGSTELFRVGTHAFYLESLVYGACQGLMLADALAVFANASAVLTADKVMGLLGNAVPTVSLMVSMTLRLVPRLVRQGATVRDVSRACTAAAPAPPTAGTRRRRAGVAEGLRLSTVLMGWSMEDSLETADAMRARGWGSAPRRTTYRRQRFRARDAGALVLVAALAAASAVSAASACEAFSFYPRLGALAPWYSYTPYVALLALPVALELEGRFRWR